MSRVMLAIHVRTSTSGACVWKRGEGGSGVYANAVRDGFEFLAVRRDGMDGES